MKINKTALLASSIGIEIGLSIGIGAFIGLYLDKQFETEPYLLIFFTFAGIGAAVKALLRIIKEIEKEDNKE